MLAAVAVAGGSGSPTPHVYALTLGSQADALGLTGTQFATPTATKDGAPIAITAWAWTVSGPATLDDDEIERPTPTHTGAGTVTRQLVATLADGAVVASAMDGWTVGDADRRVQKHHANWMLAGSAVDFTVTATKTIDGQEYTEYSPGTVNSFAATESVGLSIDPNSQHAGIRIPGDAQGVTMETDAVYYMALAANTLDTNSDAAKIIISSGAIFAAAHAQKSAGGVQQVGTENATGSAFETTAGTGQIRQLAFRIRGYLCEVYYSEAAFSGAFPACSAMTKASTAPAGFFTYDSVPGNDTTDSRAPASDFVYWMVPTASTGPVVITHTEIRVAA